MPSQSVLSFQSLYARAALLIGALILTVALVLGTSTALEHRHCSSLYVDTVVLPPVAAEVTTPIVEVSAVASSEPSAVDSVASQPAVTAVVSAPPVSTAPTSATTQAAPAAPGARWAAD